MMKYSNFQISKYVFMNEFKKSTKISQISNDLKFSRCKKQKQYLTTDTLYTTIKVINCKEDSLFTPFMIYLISIIALELEKIYFLINDKSYFPGQ